MKTLNPTSVLSRARLTAASALFVVCAAMAVFAAGQGGGASPREHLFVGFAKTPGAAERALVERHGGTVRFSFPSVNALAIDLDSAKIGDLAREAGVSYVEPDPERVPLGLNDLETSELIPDIENGLYGLVTTNVVDAHTAGFTGAGVKVCVADTGLDTTHPDIAANFKGGFNVFAGPSEDNTDVDVFSLGVETTETHATHVSGTLLGVDNSVGILGVATQAELYLARVLGTDPGGPPGKPGVTVSGTTSQVMAGAEWLADQDCKVINMSLGGGTRSRTEEALYNQITADGTLIVAAAGNEGRKRISFPAAYPTVMSVGAVDVDNEHASFSNTGTGLDISGPGVGVLSSVPMDQGRDAFVNDGTTEYQGIGMEFAGLTDSDGISGALVHCGLAQTAADCGASPPSGFIALIQRGSVSFAQKVASAMDAGAAGAIIYNNEPGNFSGTLGTEDNNGTPWIPALSVSDTDGTTLETKVGSTVTLANAPTRWDFFDGTSMATPHVAGVAGLVLGKNPSLTPPQVRQILNDTAFDLGATGYDTTFGWGLVDATHALEDTPSPPSP